MANEKRHKSVDEIIAKYGVQSISTEAVNDTPVNEDVVRPARSIEEPTTKKAEEQAVEIPISFKEPEKKRKELDASEIDEALRMAKVIMQKQSRRFQLPEDYQTKPAFKNEEVEEEKLQSAFAPAEDDYTAQNSAYDTEPEEEPYSPPREWGVETQEEDSYEGESDYYSDDYEQEPQQNWLIRFIRFFIPWRGDSVGEIIRKIIFLIALVTLIVSASILIPTLHEDWKAGQTDRQVAALYHEGSDEDKIKQAEEILGGELPQEILPEFALLYANNQDVVGWITVPDTLVDYPIARAEDNAYYMNHDYYKNKTRYGVPFMDYDCSAQPLGANTVIYGHHMNNGTVFGGLDNYRTLEGYQKRPVISFNTIYERHQWKVIGAFVTNADPADDNDYAFNYRVKNFADEADFNGYLQGVKERSLFNTNVDVTYGDKLLTLQTCGHDFHEARLVVVARMVRPGEDETVDTSAATENQNPRFPQAYYNKKGLVNPFSAGGWIPAGEEPTTSETTTEPTTTAADSEETTTQGTTEGTTRRGTTESDTTTRTTRPTTTTTTGHSSTTTTEGTTDETTTGDEPTTEPSSTEEEETTTHASVTTTEPPVTEAPTDPPAPPEPEEPSED